MDEVRNHVAEFQDVEAHLRNERNRTAQSKWRLIAASSILLVLGIGALVAFFTRAQMGVLVSDFQQSLEAATARAAELAQSQQRWVTTLASIGDAVMATDASGKITFMNPLAESLLQCDRDECIGRPIDEVFKVENEQTGAPMESPVARAIRLQRVIELGNNAVLLGSKGARTPVADSAAPIRDASGGMIGTVLVFRDVTERRNRERERAQALLREQVQRQIAEDTASRLRKIESVTEAALAHLPLEEMLRQLLRRTAQALQADTAVILLLNEQTQVLEVRAAFGLEEEIRNPVQIPVGQGIAGTIAKTGQLRVIDNLAEAEVFSPYLREKAASLMGAPLLVEDRVIGVIHVDSKKPRKFTDAEAALLQIVADRVALTIDRKRAEERIAHLASFPELNTNPIFETDLEGKLTYMNPAARRQFPKLEEAGTEHPLLEGWLSILTSLRAGGQGSIVREAKADGLVFLQTVFYYPEAGVARAYFIDITQRKQAEEALRASEERWAITLQSIGDAVISTDASGKVVFMNEVAQKLTGWPSADAKDKDLNTVFNIMQEVTRIRPENPVSKVIRLGKVVGLANHTVLIRRDGAEIPIEDSGAPIRNRRGEIEGVVLVFRDVSEQRKMEKALRNSERLATMGRLAATIAHEIHNPLDTVGNLLFLIEQGATSEETGQYISLASQELARIIQMTQQMLTFQRESAKPVPVKITDVLANVLMLYERKIESAGIKVEKEIDFQDAILAQPGEMRQVFANLVGNAIEAVASGQGKIRLRAYASRDWRRGRSGLRVVVADNGRGIPAELREKIFDPFFTTKGESGTGLGLWITTGIVSKYDGTLRLRSSARPDRSGTCFSVFFPCEIAPESTVRVE
jgi:PAS domain S-box-containing protein